MHCYNAVCISYYWDIFVSIYWSVWLISILVINRFDLVKLVVLYLFRFSSLHLLLRQRLLWKSDFISCVRFSDWSLILVSGNFIQILTLTVGFLCFTSRSAVYTNKNRFSFCYIIHLLNCIIYGDQMLIQYWSVIDRYGDQMLICVLIQLCVLFLFQIKLI